MPYPQTRLLFRSAASTTTQNASVLTSGVGEWRTVFKAVRFLCEQSLPTRHLRISSYCVPLAHSDGSSRTLIAKHGPESLLRLLTASLSS